MPRLADGTFVPEYFNVQTTSQRGAAIASSTLANSELHVGYVVKAYPPDQLRKEWTYDILAETSQGNNARTYQTFRYARLGMGGSAKDFTRQTIKTPSGWTYGGELTDEVRSQCTRVIFACENGWASRPVIIGFALHADTLFLDDRSLGHNYRWDFNGISATVNKDGEYSLKFTGAILDAASNKYIDPPADTTGTFFTFKKDGSWIVDNVKGESISLDKPGKLLSILARSMATKVSEGSYTLTAAKKVDVKAGSNAIFNGSKVFIGKEGAKDPLVKGNELAQALENLIKALTTSPFIGQLGAIPVALHPVVKASLMAWQSIYARKNTSPFLSKKGYVE